MVRVMLFSSLSQDQTPQDVVSADCTLLLSYSGQTLLKFILSSDITERGSLMFGEILLLGYLTDLGLVSFLSVLLMTLSFAETSERRWHLNKYAARGNGGIILTSEIEVLGGKHVTDPHCSLQMSHTLLNLDSNPGDTYLKVYYRAFLKRKFIF